MGQLLPRPRPMKDSSKKGNPRHFNSEMKKILDAYADADLQKF